MIWIEFIGGIGRKISPTLEILYLQQNKSDAKEQAFCNIYSKRSTKNKMMSWTSYIKKDDIIFMLTHFIPKIGCTIHSGTRLYVHILYRYLHTQFSKSDIKYIIWQCISCSLIWTH